MRPTSLRRMAPKCAFLLQRRAAAWRSSRCRPVPCRSRLPIARWRKCGSSLAERAACGARHADIEDVTDVHPGISITIPVGAAFQFRCDGGRAARRGGRHHAALAGHGRSLCGRWQVVTLYQLPVFGMLAQGSATGSASPFCSSSIEIPSGVWMKAMRPSRGGRLMVMPCFCRLAQ